MSSTKLRKVATRSRTRRVILWIHLWLSLAVGVFILAIALSGTALVFHAQTDRLIFYPELYRETSRTTAVEETYPDRRVSGLTLPRL